MINALVLWCSSAALRAKKRKNFTMKQYFRVNAILIRAFVRSASVFEAQMRFDALEH